MEGERNEETERERERERERESIEKLKSLIQLKRKGVVERHVSAGRWLWLYFSYYPEQCLRASLCFGQKQPDQNFLLFWPFSRTRKAVFASEFEVENFPFFFLFELFFFTCFVFLFLFYFSSFI